MTHHPTYPNAPVPVRYGDALLYPPAVPGPLMPLAEITPGIQLVTLPDGTRTLTPIGAPAPVPVVVPGPAGIPGWAKTTALLAPTIGAGIGGAGFGLAYAAPGLIALADALWATVALIAAGALITLTRPRRGTARPTTHITQHITTTGLFSRATGTITHR
ncbi:hypothetical protein [Streptomyces sp. NPDC051567]|uniref:hypothetical protein n=1 Tax=Streptomyces sp. NPDC051567 TaxID=3365660 RepID=UPI0037BB7F0D